MRLKLITSVILIAVLSAACGSANPPQEQESTPDVSIIRTSAAGTVISQFTLTAAVFTPTPSRPTEPSETATPSTPQASSTATTQPAAQVTNAQGTIVALCDSLE